MKSCPICGSTQFETLSSYSSSVTSDSAFSECSVKNVICCECKTILNATGIRGQEVSFYDNHYSLLSEAAEAEFVYETNSGRRGINDLMIDFLENTNSLPRRGQFLEVGCGKGIFLSKFKERFPEWSISALEPSKNARKFLEKKHRSLKVHGGTLETFDSDGVKFDLIAALGVLEHIPSPKDFIELISLLLNDNGLAFVMVPNFDYNPCDLGICDHLTRFTPDSFRQLMAISGFQVVEMNQSVQVPMWALLKKKASSIGSLLANDVHLRASHASSWFRNALNTYKQASNELSENEGRRIGVYGTGTLMMSAVQEGCISLDNISVIFEDNPTLIGQRRFGIPIISLEERKNQKKPIKIVDFYDFFYS